jgi:hypothetical protein
MTIEPSLVILKRAPGCSFSQAAVVPAASSIVGLQELLDGAECQTIEVLDWQASNVLRGYAWINEEGKLREPWVVTCLVTDGQCGPAYDAIIGPMVFTGGMDRDGETLALPKADAIELADAINQSRPIVVMREYYLRARSLPS